MTRINANKREFWYEHVTHCQSSNLSQVEYCREKNLNFNTFTYWRVRYLRSKKEISSKNPKGSFLPVIIQPKQSEITHSSTSATFTIILSNQVKLLLPSNLPQQEMLNILKIVGELS